MKLLFEVLVFEGVENEIHFDGKLLLVVLFLLD
jgi:hypothetical protein